MIKVGDTLPAATLMEFSEVEGNGCSIGPNPVDVSKASAGKTIALFAVPWRIHAHLLGQARAQLPEKFAAN
jgi:peroxiredoxin